jgi:hypothetical protein
MTTANIRILGDYIYDTLVAASPELGINDIFKGDQLKIARTPTVCIEPTTKRRQLVGAPRRTETEVEFDLLVYHSRVDDNQRNREDLDILADGIEEVIHKDPTMGGLVIHSMVSSMDPGYSAKGSVFYRAYKITVQCQIREMLPY